MFCNSHSIVYSLLGVIATAQKVHLHSNGCSRIVQVWLAAVDGLHFFPQVSPPFPVQLTKEKIKSEA